MRFEEHVGILCAQAVAAHDETEVRKILAELRLVLHQRIEQLRTGVQSGFLPSKTPAGSLERRTSLRTWEKVVQEITIERDAARALRLSQELNRLLNGHKESAIGRVDSA